MKIYIITEYTEKIIRFVTFSRGRAEKIVESLKHQSLSIEQHEVMENYEEIKMKLRKYEAEENSND